MRAGRRFTEKSERRAARAEPPKAPPAGAPPPPVERVECYEIKSGDTLSVIGKQIGRFLRRDIRSQGVGTVICEVPIKRVIGLTPFARYSWRFESDCV
jgi:hypothetical protein